jgi:uncharacterized protein
MLRAAERHYVLQVTRGPDVQIIASRVELAVDSESRRRGLLGRDHFDEGAALIIAPSSAIHTFSMRFAIDVVFVSRDGRVRKTYSAVGPRRIAVSFGAFAVIELPAGALSGSFLKAGEILQLVSR